MADLRGALAGARLVSAEVALKAAEANEKRASRQEAEARRVAQKARLSELCRRVKSALADFQRTGSSESGALYVRLRAQLPMELRSKY